MLTALHLLAELPREGEPRVHEPPLRLFGRLQAQHGAQVLARHHRTLAAQQRRGTLQPRRRARVRESHQALYAEACGRLESSPAAVVELRAEYDAPAQQHVERVSRGHLVVHIVVPVWVWGLGLGVRVGMGEGEGEGKGEGKGESRSVVSGEWRVTSGEW